MTRICSFFRQRRETREAREAKEQAAFEAWAIEILNGVANIIWGG